MTKKLKFWRYILKESKMDSSVLTAVSEHMDNNWNSCLIGEHVSLHNPSKVGHFTSHDFKPGIHLILSAYYKALQYEDPMLLELAINLIEKEKSVFK